MFSSKDLFFTPAAGGFTVSKSLRFRSSATAYLNRTPGSAGNRKTWTWSGWVKRGKLSSGQMFFEAGNTSGTTNSDLLIFQFNSADNIRIDTGASVLRVTNAVFRDPSAWYHIVILMDTTQASNNSTRIFVNNVEQTYSTTNNIPQNTDTAVNNTVVHYLGRYDGSVNFFDGYLAEVNFINGYAYDPTYFGAYDTNGVWQPKQYTGSYDAASPNTGFYLKFTTVGATSGSNTGYGQDFSGNGNYWTTNNFGTTSTATTYDSMLDSPTNAAGDIGNYAVWSPLVLFPNTTNQATMSNGNLLVTRSAGGLGGAVTTIGATSGKYYAEITVTAVGSSVPRVAVIADNNPPSINSANEYYPGGGTTSVAYRSDGGKTYNNSTTASWGSTYTTNDVIGIAFDADSGKVWFGKQIGGTGSMTWQASGDPAAGTNPANTLGTGVPFYFSAGGESGVQMSFNTGQRPLSATAPSGFSALNTQNLSTPTITNGAQYMAAMTYTGDGTTPRSLTMTSTNTGNNPNGTTFQPDFVWIKDRTTAYSHMLFDVVRGAGSTKDLSSNNTGAEGQFGATYGYVSAFNSAGFSVTKGTDPAYIVNASSDAFIAWQWKAGGTGVTNTSGSITSTVSASATAGFSVVTYTYSSGTSTVGHGLGVTPSMIIVKRRDSTGNWVVAHIGLTNMSGYYILLESTGAQAAASWGGSPTSSLFYVSSNIFAAGNYVAYCFAPVAGYSAFGSYTGNGSADGPFIYTGMRPRWILTKRTDTTGNWWIFDTSRDPYNVEAARLSPNLSNAEATSAVSFDVLSNGFKVRGTDVDWNASGGTYIYAAFAENPFKISRAR